MQISIDDKHLPGNQSVRIAMVLREHQRAIDELDSDIQVAEERINKKVEGVDHRLIQRFLKLETRVWAIENTRYRRFGRWVKRIFQISPKKDQANDSKG